MSSFSFAGRRHFIRVRDAPKEYYEGDYSAEGETSESDSDAITEADNQTQMINRLKENRERIAEYVKEGKWKIEREKDSSFILMRNPTTSQIMDHRVLHPALFCQIQKLDSLDQLAQMVGAPSDWEAKYEQLIPGNETIQEYFTDFRNLPESAPENVVQSAFYNLFFSIRYYTKSFGQYMQGKPCVVGGLLASEEYDILTESGYIVYLGEEPVLATEIASTRSFNAITRWYQDSQTVRLFNMLYTHACPTLLFNQKVWKFFVENQDRTQVLSFPFDNCTHLSRHANSCMVEKMGPTFLKTIFICMLTPVTFIRRLSLIAPSFSKSLIDFSDSDLSESESDNESSEISSIVSEPRECTLCSSPSFISGLDENGNSIRTYIRVYSKEKVSKILKRMRAKYGEVSDDG